MLRKVWKILWISTLSFIAFVIIVATLVHIFVPEDELKKASAPETVEPAEPEPPSIQYKTVDWTQTPEGQGLAVGDWIVARGHPDALISAMRTFKGHLHQLGSIDTSSGYYDLGTLRGNTVQVFELSYIENGSIGVIPAKSPIPPNIKIRSILVFNIPNSTQHSAIKQFNLLRLHRLDAITDIIISGRIKRIGASREKDGHLRQSLTLEDEGCTFQLTAAPEQIARAMEQAKANAAAVKQKFDQLRSQFLGWGFQLQHWNTSEYVQSRMHNPKSFKHVRTTFTTNEAESYRLINMKYRGTNVYNAVVTHTIRVKVTLDGKVIGVVSDQ